MKIQQYLEKLCNFLEIDSKDIQLDVKEEDDRVDVFLTVPENDAKLLIGSKGETMEALEYLTKSVFKDDFADKKIILDVNGYKQQKILRLKEKAIAAGKQVLETGVPYTFDYLNSFERYIVHSEIANNDEFADLESFSEDVDGDRLLTIRKK